jgi:hypothetical protein
VCGALTTRRSRAVRFAGMTVQVTAGQFHAAERVEAAAGYGARVAKKPAMAAGSVRVCGGSTAGVGLSSRMA